MIWECRWAWIYGIRLRQTCRPCSCCFPTLPSFGQTGWNGTRGRGPCTQNRWMSQGSRGPTGLAGAWSPWEASEFRILTLHFDWRPCFSQLAFSCRNGGWISGCKGFTMAYNPGYRYTSIGGSRLGASALLLWQYQDGA